MPVRQSVLAVSAVAVGLAMATLAGCGPTSVSVPATPATSQPPADVSVPTATVTNPPPAVASVPAAPATERAPADNSDENEGSGGENEPDENEGGNKEP
jgi:hypothetical protein